MFPVRCFTCNNVIGGRWKKYKEISNNKSIKDAFTELNIKRYCCRRMFLGHVEIIPMYQCKM